MESKFQKRVIDRLRDLFPGCVVLKNDSGYMQGIPDLVIFFEQEYAFLEVKANFYARHQPNQDYWVDKLNHMSYAAFISPENEEEILDDLQQTFSARRAARISQSII